MPYRRWRSATAWHADCVADRVVAAAHQENVITDSNDKPVAAISRRGFLGGVALAGASVSLRWHDADAQEAPARSGVAPVAVKLRGNDVEHALMLDPRVTLL